MPRMRKRKPVRAAKTGKARKEAAKAPKEKGRFTVAEKLIAQVRYYETLYLIFDPSGERIYTGSKESAERIASLLNGERRTTTTTTFDYGELEKRVLAAQKIDRWKKAEAKRRAAVRAYRKK